MKQSSISRHTCAFILFISVSGSAYSIEFAEAAWLGSSLLLGVGAVVREERLLRNIRQQRRELIRLHLVHEIGSDDALEHYLCILNGKSRRGRTRQRIIIGTTLMATAIIALLSVRARGGKKPRDEVTLCKIEEFLTLKEDDRFAVVQKRYGKLLKCICTNKKYSEKRWRKYQKLCIKHISAALTMFNELKDTVTVEEYLPILLEHYSEATQPRELRDMQEYYDQIKVLSNEPTVSIKQIGEAIHVLRGEFCKRWEDDELFDSIMQRAIVGSRFYKAVKGDF